jgi:hypothetical protein
MAKIWVKGYTKKDGTKVPGHYRETSGERWNPDIMSKERFMAERRAERKGQKSLKKIRW